MLNYDGLVKQLDLPAGWKAPAELAYDDIRARAISRADNDDDVQGINASIELQQRPLGGISDGLAAPSPRRCTATRVSWAARDHATHRPEAGPHCPAAA